MSNTFSGSTASRIGKGRLPASSMGAGTEAAVRVPAKTPDAIKTNAVSDQHISHLQQSGHNASTPVINIAPGTTSRQEQQTSMQTSRWGNSGTSDAGPVFQVVTRGNRVPLATSGTSNPPSHPVKTQPTASRTRSSAPQRSSASSATSSPSISLRNRSGNGGGTTTNMAFGSRLDRSTGRLPASSLHKAGPTPPAADNCTSVARVLSFEDPASPVTSSRAAASHGGGEPEGAGDTASEMPAGHTAAEHLESRSAGVAGTADGSMDAVDQSLEDITKNSGSDSTSWLSGGNEEAPGMLNPASTANSKLTAPSVPIAFPALPEVHDTQSATAAAKVLLQQLLEAVAAVMDAAGVSAACTAVAAACQSDVLTVAGTELPATYVNLQQEDTAAGDSRLKADHKNMLQVLLDKTSAMLATGAAAVEARQAVLPALMLLMADMANDQSNSLSANLGSDTADGATAAPAGARDSMSPAPAGAAATLASAVTAGIAAAKTVLLLDAGSQQAANASDPYTTSQAAGQGVGPAGTSRTGSTDRKHGWLRRILGAVMLLLWSLVLLITGYVAAVAWTLIEGSSVIPASGAGSSGVIAADTGGAWMGGWSYIGGVDSGVWDTGDVLLGRRVAH